MLTIFKSLHKLQITASWFVDFFQHKNHVHPSAPLGNGKIEKTKKKSDFPKCSQENNQSSENLASVGYEQINAYVALTDGAVMV